MKKTILLNEAQLIRLIKNIINESLDINPKKLKLGDKGPDVVELQQKLIDLKLLRTKTGKPTGTFGRYTEEALKKYNDNNLTMDEKDDFPLSFGSKGRLVKQLQKALLVIYPNSLPKYGVDGNFGTETKNLLKSKKLPTIVDKKTFNQIIEKSKKQGGGSTTPIVPEKPDSFILSKNASTDYLSQINPKKISVSDTTNYVIRKPDTTDCAQFVNNFSTKISSVLDAWLAHDIEDVGKRIFSIYTKIDSGDIETYKKLYKKAVQDTITDSEIKNFNLKLLSKKGNPPQLKIDDIVGIYNESSHNHKKAFLNGGKNYFFNGDPNKPGNTLLGGRGFSFNTHVGIVGATKNGIPIVFHNVNGNVKSDPANNLKITWVKRK